MQMATGSQEREHGYGFVSEHLGSLKTQKHSGLVAETGWCAEADLLGLRCTMLPTIFYQYLAGPLHLSGNKEGIHPDFFLDIGMNILYMSEQLTYWDSLSKSQ